ncbi:hypothetical protein F3K38_07080 [Streptomyces sp. LBUM 1488]|nr:hypothetical protein [Streptomyces sp. LBUM 1488]
MHLHSAHGYGARLAEVVLCGRWGRWRPGAGDVVGGHSRVVSRARLPLERRRPFQLSLQGAERHRLARLGEDLEGAGDARFEARNAFGFRNRRANQRLRSRCATTRRSRREAHPHYRYPAAGQREAGARAGAWPESGRALAGARQGPRPVSHLLGVPGRTRCGTARACPRTHRSWGARRQRQ